MESAVSLGHGRGHLGREVEPRGEVEVEQCREALDGLLLGVRDTGHAGVVDEYVDARR